MRPLFGETFYSWGTFASLPGDLTLTSVISSISAQICISFLPIWYRAALCPLPPILVRILSPLSSVCRWRRISAALICKSHKSCTPVVAGRRQFSSVPSRTHQLGLLRSVRTTRTLSTDRQAGRQTDKQTGRWAGSQPDCVVVKPFGTVRQ